MLVQETKQDTFYQLSDLPVKVQRTLTETRCQNCEKKALSHQKICYNIASNGKVVWWHDTTYDGNAPSCQQK